MESTIAQHKTDLRSWQDQTPEVRRAIRTFSDLLQGKVNCILMLEGCSWPISKESGDSVEEDVVIHFPSRYDFLQFSRHFRLINFANMYVHGGITYQGSAEQVIEVALALEGTRASLREKIIDTLWPYLQRFVPRLRNATSSFVEHYDQRPELFEALLDPYMQYTCAWFYRDDEDLETAQLNKLRFMADRLKIGGGTRHLDIGCGWGGAIRYFVEEHGARSTGITNSKIQAAYADRVLNGTKPGTALIQHCDFAEFHSPELFDAITVVGMLEHLSRSRKDELLRYVHDHLSVGGRIYLQCITKPKDRAVGDAGRFLQKYVFPGYYLDTINTLLDRIDRAKLTVVWRTDPHHGVQYGRTAQHWLTNLRGAKVDLLQNDIIDPRSYRILEAYLAFGSKVHLEGNGELHRLVLRRNN